MNIRESVDQTKEELYLLLESSSDGLGIEEVEKRQARDGKNTIQETHKIPEWKVLLKNFTHLMAILLWLGAIIAFVANLKELGIAIIFVILINGSFSYWQERRANKATEALKKLLPHYAQVIRDSKIQKILVEDLVVGDLLLFEEGDLLSADARVLEDTNLKVNQSMLTGESTAVRKGSERIEDTSLTILEYPNLIFAGTSVVQGHGKAIVCNTGMNTAFGQIAKLTQTLGNEKSPLQKELDVLTKQVSLFAFVLALLFFLSSMFIVKESFAFSFIFALGMIVAFIPEGLLPTVTLSLAMAVQRLAKRNALVKKLSSVETLGSTNYICTDKTGTLTQNEMSVTKLWVNEKEHLVSGIGYQPKGTVDDCNEDVLEVLKGFALCNNAKLFEKEGSIHVIGDPTEGCLLVVAQKGNLNLETLMNDYPRIYENPFDSTRKAMSTIHLYNNEKIAYVKGACKELLDACTTYQGKLLTQQKKDEIMRINDQFALDGLRVLGLCKKIVSSTRVSTYTIENIESDLEFMGLIAMQDPPRVEVYEAVQKCHSAGIRIIMVTGDYGLTAKSIAKKIGIIKDEVEIITGSSLQYMKKEELKKAFEKDVIFARVAPEQKLQIVECLQEMGNIVAVTGDGVNDAPALKKADIGVAMGISGSDVAKESADMILSDDNFASIVSAIEEGRAVYANIRKFILYILNSNMPEGAPSAMFLFSKGGIPLPLQIMQILAIDLGTDMLPALGLGVEEVEADIMNHPPRNRKESLLNKSLFIKAFLWYGMLEIVALVVSYYAVNLLNGYTFTSLAPLGSPVYIQATTMALGSIVFCQVGMVLNCRSDKQSILTIGIFKNKRIVFGIIFEIILFACIVYIPFLQGIFTTSALQFTDWMILCIFPFFVLIPEEIRKYYVRRKEAKI